MLSKSKAFINSWKTAPWRKKMSAPTRFLMKHYIGLNCRVLDFGCGRGFDADLLGFVKYDPHFFPTKPKGKFDVVVANYVINVLPKHYVDGMLSEIKGYLKRGGTAYITVSRRVKTDGFTSIGTYQRHVVLTSLPSVYKDGDKEIYVLRK